MAFCRECGKPMGDTARFCPTCGAAAPEQSASPSRFPRGYGPSDSDAMTRVKFSRPLTGLSMGLVGWQIGAALGSFLLFIGPFLPWARAFVFSASGLQKTGDEALFLVFFGLIGMAMTVVGLVLRKGWAAGVQVVLGALGLALSVLYLVQLRADMPDLGEFDGMISIGGGIYLCVIGSIIMIAGAVYSMVVARKAD